MSVLPSINEIKLDINPKPNLAPKPNRAPKPNLALKPNRAPKPMQFPDWVIESARPLGLNFSRLRVMPSSLYSCLMPYQICPS
jgi:hypothetical protein